MAKNNQRELELDRVERETLEAMRDNHPKAYLRERAAALLKVADGASARWVAHQGLLKRRNFKTVLEWLDRYEATGLGGLYIKSGRGRPPAYEP